MSIDDRYNVQVQIKNQIIEKARKQNHRHRREEQKKATQVNQIPHERRTLQMVTMNLVKERKMKTKKKNQQKKKKNSKLPITWRVTLLIF